MVGLLVSGEFNSDARLRLMFLLKRISVAANQSLTGARLN